MPEFIHTREPISKLIPYVGNSRTHSEAQIKQIALSIKEFGFTSPILIDAGGGIIAGHGRLMAADLLGLDEAPCITVSGWTDAQKKAYVIADNQLALNAEWDINLLKVEIDGLKDIDFNIELLGFDGVFLANLYMDGAPLINSPEEFKPISEAELSHICPKCGFEFDE